MGATRASSEEWSRCRLSISAVAAEGVLVHANHCVSELQAGPGLGGKLSAGERIFLGGSEPTV